MIKNKFNRGDEVFHITPDSPMGIVIDWQYTKSTNAISYLVAWTYNEEGFFPEDELQSHKRF